MTGIALPHLGRDRLVCVREGMAVRVRARSPLAKQRHCEPVRTHAVPLVPQRSSRPNSFALAGTDSYGDVWYVRRGIPVGCWYWVCVA